MESIENSQEEVTSMINDDKGNSVDSNLTEGKQLDINGEILYRRTFGKHLCFLTLIYNNNNNNNNNDSHSNEIECILHDTTHIRQVSIGDIINITGTITLRKSKPQLEVLSLQILKKTHYTNQINEKRITFLSTKHTPSSTSIQPQTKFISLCRFIKKGLPCPHKDTCLFRHDILNSTEQERLIHFKQTKQHAYSLVHEGDPFNADTKYKKGARNSHFADFIVNTFTLDYLKRGFILDVAGGKGITSFYLTTKYNLTCTIVDPRGVSMSKKYLKVLHNNKQTITEKRIMFDDTTCDELIGDNCVLIIGMHPDEATGDIVKVALRKKINFAVVPCCVFNCKFPERKLLNGKDVVEYNDIVQYLIEQDEEKKIKVDFLNIEGRNKVLYRVTNRIDG